MKLLICLFTVSCLFACAELFKLPGQDAIMDYFGGRTTTNSTKSDDKDKSKDNGTVTGEQVCFGVLGCFNKTYYSEQNLPSVGWFAPDNPDNLDITIMHFVDLDNKGQKLRFNSTQIDRYNKGAKNYFIVHGWQSGFSYESWLDDLKDTVLKVSNDQANVFVVDWSKIAGSILYPLSAANTKLVGRAVGYFIVNTLVKNYGVDCRNIHLMGHSLGGQTVGFVGKFTKTHNCFIQRITALDAAGPFFRTSDPNERITKDDAFFVEALHTNAANIVLTGLGTMTASGTVDYWPDGGSTQEGCELSDQLASVVKNGLLDSLDAPSCSHLRAPQIYATNYDRLASCQLVAYQCKDFASYKRGECADCGEDGSKCRLLGLSRKWDPMKQKLPKSNDAFYVHTTGESPYCYHAYQIKITTGNLTSRAIGSLYVNVIGQKRDLLDQKIASPTLGFEGNKTYTLLVEKDLPIEEVQKVEIYYDENFVGDVFSSAKVDVLLDRVEVNYMSNIDRATREKYSGVFEQEEQSKISKSSKDRTLFNRV